MESALRGGIALELGLGAMLLQRPDSSAASAETPGSGLPLPHGPGGEMDPLGTVGLALLAYGLVQLLSKVVDKLPVWRAGDVGPARAPAATAPPGGDGGGFTAEDRKRLERVYEQAVADRQRLERLEESVREQLAVQQRLVGQALDDLRTVHAQLDNIVRKLRAVWTRIGRRRKDRG
jgi:hypothetical protein